MNVLGMLGDDPSLLDWEKVMKSQASHLDIAKFQNAKTSEAIRRKLKYNADNPKK